MYQLKNSHNNKKITIRSSRESTIELYSYLGWIFVYSLIINFAVNNSQASRTDQEILENVQKLCKDIKKNVRTISAMQQLIDDVVKLSIRVRNNELEVKQLKSAEKCIAQASAFQDLKYLVNIEDVDVCHPTYVDKLVAYHNEYVKYDGYVPTSLTSSKRFKKFVPNIIFSQNVWVTSEFFKIFATQVTFVCKMSLEHNIKNIAFPQFTLEDYRIIVPWLDLDNIELMGHMERVDDLELTHYQRGKRQRKYKKQANKRRLQCKRNGDDTDPNVAEVYLSETTRNKLKDIKAICPKFKQYYDGAIISVVRLAKIGYSPKMPTVEDGHKNSDELRLWLLIVQLCDTFENINLAENDVDSEQPNVVKLVLNTVDYSDELAEVDTFIDSESTKGKLRMPNTLAQPEPKIQTASVKLRSVSYDRNVNQIQDNLFIHEVNFVGSVAAIRYFVHSIKNKIGKIFKKLVQSGSMIVETNDPDHQVGFAQELLESFEQEYRTSIGDVTSQEATRKKRTGRLACGTYMCLMILLSVFVIGSFLGPKLWSSLSG